MSFVGYGNKAMQDTKSSVSQRKGQGNCYIVAPVAAYSLIKGNQYGVGDVIKAVGVGIGGNARRAFKAMGLGCLDRNDGYRGSWPNIIRTCVDNNLPICLGVEWQLEHGGGSGNHVVYAIGHDDYCVYARDQQNSHVLIRIPMGGPWKSHWYKMGKNKSACCVVKWLNCGYGPDQRDIVRGLL